MGSLHPCVLWRRPGLFSLSTRHLHSPQPIVHQCCSLERPWSTGLSLFGQGLKSLAFGLLCMLPAVSPATPCWLAPEVLSSPPLSSSSCHSAFVHPWLHHSPRSSLASPKPGSLLCMFRACPACSYSLGRTGLPGGLRTVQHTGWV